MQVGARVKPNAVATMAAMTAYLSARHDMLTSGSEPIGSGDRGGFALPLRTLVGRDPSSAAGKTDKM